MTNIVKFLHFKYHHDLNSGAWFLAWIYEIDGKSRYMAFQVDKATQRDFIDGHDIISRDLREYIRDRITAYEFLRIREESYDTTLN